MSALEAGSAPAVATATKVTAAAVAAADAQPGATFHGEQFAVFAVLFAVVVVLGFWASRWRRGGKELNSLDEWGLGGRRFGGFVAWFLIGGDVFTAYTFVAVPGAMYASGAVSGWYAVAFTTMIWPIFFVVMPRLWDVSRRHGYVTPADLVRGRYGSQTLALAVAVTGVVATMPYIALQLVGMQAVLEVMGVGAGATSGFVRDLPVIVAFGVLAVCTYTAGLRAPALLAFVKDFLIYLVVAVAIVVLPHRFGGFGHIFDAAQHKFDTANAAAVAAGRKPSATLIPGSKDLLAYATLALGSAMALFLYPHSITGVLSTRSRNVIRRNAVVLPLYAVLLAFIALLGYVAIAAGVHTTNPRLAIPLLFDHEFPAWFAGVAFAAIAVGALVPAAIMSIAAANLFTRTIYVGYLRRDASAAEQTRVSKVASLLVKFGALVFVLGLDTQNSINLQLLGGVWMLQTFPAVVLGLWRPRLHRYALLTGWAVGMLYGTVQAYHQHSLVAKHFGGALAVVPGLGRTGYIALTAFTLNLAIAVAGTLLLRALRVPNGQDLTLAPTPTVDDHPTRPGTLVGAQASPRNVAPLPAAIPTTRPGQPTTVIHPASTPPSAAGTSHHTGDREQPDQ
ncbi:sodium:solute symporter [Frankia sp. Ag45/Mut15]|uniref:Sodium:solute symporter n=1 Tax=Frankia umida TaxID=573489 RepID=A0ABT0JVJ6_9ACTN|nr:sodium:solute symporter [Frankia umida]MCK9875247.1 sodium:solute symporter [Frankia umida]